MPLQRLDHAPDAAVHLLDHGAVDRHPNVLILLVINILPRRRILVPRRDRPLRIDNSQTLLLLMPGGPNLVPTPHVLALVLDDIVLPSVERPVRRGERDVLEKRFAGRHRVIDLRRRVIRNRVRQMKIVRLHLDQLILQHQRLRIPIRVGRFQQAEIPVEPPLRRQRVFRIARCPLVTQPTIVTAACMPLARHQRPVTRALCHLAHRHTVIPQIPLIARHTQIRRHLPDTCLMRVQPRQQSRPRRTAPRTVIHLRKPDPVVAQSIQIRRANLTPVTPDI